MDGDRDMSEQRKEDQNTQNTTLEENFRELDDILTKMEDREVSLEDAFSLYERGMQKIRECNEKLDLVEKKMLVIAQDGQEVPFEG